MEVISLRSYADFEIWVGAVPGNRKGQYPVQVVISPDGYGDTVMNLDIDAEDFQSELTRVRGRESNRELRQQFGKRLFDALFTGDVRDRWKGSIGRVKGSRRPVGLRLLLKILDADLAALPWELLYDVQAGGFLGATANQTVARFLPMAEPKSFQSTDKLRVLFVIQSPQPGQSEKLTPIPEEEIAILEESMRRLGDKGVACKVLKNASTSAIFDELQSEEYHVLHYLGHGGAGELYLVAEAEQPFSAIDDVSFAHFFLGRESVRLVVLNACSSSQVEGAGLFSGIGPALVSVGVPAVIAMQYEAVYTDTASLFSERFYSSLANGLPVDVAVNEARQFLSSKHLADRDWSTPVLYMGTRSGHILSLPGASVDGALAPEKLIELLEAVTSQVALADKNYAELDRRAKRLREWLDVQSHIADVRNGVDRLNGYIQDAVKLVSKTQRYLFAIDPDFKDELNAAAQISQRLREQFQIHAEALDAEAHIVLGQVEGIWTIVDTNREFLIRGENTTLNVYQQSSKDDIKLGRIRLESVVDQWEKECQQDFRLLKELLGDCKAIVMPDSDQESSSKSSILGWAEALEATQRSSQVIFGQELAALDDEGLKSVCGALDNQGRQLRDWLRDRDNDCRNRLVNEAKVLADRTSRLCHHNV